MSSTPSWRDIIQVHPAADLFPMLSPDELKVLGEDIRKHGLHQAIIIFSEGNGDELLLDGRNRLDAMECVGIKFNLERRKHGWWELNILEKGVPSAAIDLACTVGDSVDPYAYVIGANIHRRHLNAEDKRDLIKTVLKAQPEKSNRTVAKQTKTDHKTVGAVRDKLEARGEIPHVSTVEDSKGRKQPAKKPPARKKRRTIDDYLTSKKARLAVANDADDVPNPASLEAEIMDCVESALSVDTAKPATATPPDTAAPKKPVPDMSTELTLFEQAFSARVRAWCEVADPHSPYRATLAGLVGDFSFRMDELAQEIIEGSKADDDETPRASQGVAS